MTWGRLAASFGRRTGVLLVLLFAAGCAHVARPAPGLANMGWPHDLPERAELAQVPFFPQEDFQCGPAALATVMAYAGAVVAPHDVAPQVYIPARQGSLQVEMLAAPRRYGLVSESASTRSDDLMRTVASGIPVVVLQRIASWLRADWHYAVVVGFDRDRQHMLLRSGTRRLETMSFDEFEESWNPGGRWAMTVTRPERIPPAVAAPRHLLAVHAMARVSGSQAAAAAYEAFLRRWPGHLEASIALGNALHARGRLEEAEGVLRSALESNPDSAALMNNLAQTLCDEGRAADALALIRRAASHPGSFAESIEATRASILLRLAAVPPLP